MATPKDLSSAATPEQVLDLMVNRGGGSYFGEPVTVLQHSLQAAFFARSAGSKDSLVVAALLHDVGHLLHSEDESIAELGVDTRHEELGDAYLAPHLPPEVTEPIRLHVAAKRYLCAIEPEYLKALSPSSLVSLALQGGPMSEVEAAEFWAQPFAEDGVALRRWDDQAKVPNLDLPRIITYLPALRAVWR